ncbi:MAG: hypothetical protein ACTSPU_16235 [Promethearchaeota archaeon]
MSTIFYKVIFKGIKGDSSESYSLTFKNIVQDKLINISSQFFSSLKREVVKIGDSSTNYDFNYYIVILYTSITDGKKEGFLVGNLKKLGDILIGIWPFNQENTHISSEHILNKLDLLATSNKFKNICVIYT